MSGIDVQRCEIERIDKDPLDSKNVLTTEKKSNTVAVELLHDIVENALDSVLNEDLETRNNCMVGDIVDQFTPRATKITDLYDLPGEKKKKLTSTEEEVKKFIGEISSPSAKGIGDQILDSEEIVTKKKSLTISSRNFALEKKTRLTDLVRSSRSLISKFLSNDGKSKDTEWEEHNEEFVKNIELNQMNPSLQHRSSHDQNIRLVTPSHSGEMIRIPDETGMENVSLRAVRLSNIEPLSDLPREHIQKSMTFPIASCSKIPTEEDEIKECAKDKKKWGLGSKIVNYIKKKASKRDMTKSEA